jgi:23S rRNA G2069 N7-methylase RlmK/C1962 C5-methylase RlmI
LNALIRGQAREVTCVDLDEKAVALARENGNANNVRLDVVHADAFGYARQMAQNSRCYGVIILDPPKLILDREDIDLVNVRNLEASRSVSNLDSGLLCSDIERDASGFCLDR